MLEPEIATLLHAGAANAVPFDPDRIPVIREGMRHAGAALPAPSIRTSDHAAGAVPVRLYEPPACAAAEGWPLLVFLHGGGWLLGDLDSHDAACRLLADRVGCAVLAVEYRLAPEHPYPAALNDSMAAWRWAREHATALGCDVKRIAVGGESAGANLAAALAILLRDTGQPAPVFQLLVHPATDLSLSQPSIDAVTLAGLDRHFLETCVQMYANGQDLTDPLVSPLRCPDLSGLPSAIVYTVEIDPLRDDGEAYALALAKAGNDVFVRRLIGLPHGFMFLPMSIAAVDRAIDLLAGRVAAYFGSA